MGQPSTASPELAEEGSWRSEAFNSKNKTGASTPCGGYAGSPFPRGDGGLEGVDHPISLHPASPLPAICQSNVNIL